VEVEAERRVLEHKLEVVEVAEVDHKALVVVEEHTAWEHDHILEVVAEEEEQVGHKGEQARLHGVERMVVTQVILTLQPEGELGEEIKELHEQAQLEDLLTLVQLLQALVPQILFLDLQQEQHVELVQLHEPRQRNPSPVQGQDWHKWKWCQKGVSGIESEKSAFVILAFM